MTLIEVHDFLMKLQISELQKKEDSIISIEPSFPFLLIRIN